MKNYHPQNSQINFMSGIITSISDDRTKFELKSFVKKNVGTDPETKKDKYETIAQTHYCSVALPLDEHCNVGGRVSVVTRGSDYDEEKDIDVEKALTVIAGNGAYDMKREPFSLINGRIKFATYRDEKDENGQPKMSKEYITQDGQKVAPHPKKAHFDIGISVPEQTEDGNTRWITHTIKVYEKTGADGKIDNKQVYGLKKKLENVDLKNEAVYATIVTTPAPVTSYTTEKDGKEYINYSCQHMGYRSMDIDFPKDLELVRKEAGITTEATKESTPTADATPVEAKTPDSEPTPEPTTPEPTSSGSGFVSIAAGLASEISELDDEIWKE